MNAPPTHMDFSFPHRWQAEILAGRPLILPRRHFVYPGRAEEVERGALEVHVRPGAQVQAAGHTFPQGLKPLVYFQKVAARLKSCPDTSCAPDRAFAQPAKPSTSSSAPEGTAKAVPFQSTGYDAQPFLATCALGFRDPAVPTGLWSAPNPDELCAVSGGYAYVIDTTDPERFAMIAYRPVLEVRPLLAQGLLLFVGHHAILAWGCEGQAWESEKLSSEGVAITSVDGSVLNGLGWDLMTDKETPFALDLRSGIRI